MVKRFDNDLHSVYDFLKVKTPDAWLQRAVTEIPLLLLDHAHCERKAASTAIHMISKYPEKAELVALMSPLAREELLHFEKVIGVMQSKGLTYRPLQPGDYATKLHQHVTQKNGVDKLCDQLIIGAIIEARSCERFHALIACLPDADLAKFYTSLVKSELRHFENYLQLVECYGGNRAARIQQFLELENALILQEDPVFRFHSGVPLELN